MGITTTGDGPLVHADGHVTPPGFYNPVPDPNIANHEIDPATLGRKEVPRHDAYALENTGEPSPDRIVPYTPSGGNPSYPGDAVEGFGQETSDGGQAETETETEAPAEAEPPVLNPAGIPAPPPFIPSED